MRQGGTLFIGSAGVGTKPEVAVGFMDKAKQLADQAAAKAKVVAADAKEKSGPALEKAKVKAGGLEEKAQPALRKVEAGLKEFDAKASPVIEDAARQVSDFVSRTFGTTKEPDAKQGGPGE